MDVTSLESIHQERYTHAASGWWTLCFYMYVDRANSE